MDEVRITKMVVDELWKGRLYFYKGRVESQGKGDVSEGVKSEDESLEKSVDGCKVEMQ